MSGTGQPISVVVEDKIAPSIQTKLKGIAQDARDADDAVARLQAQIAGLDRLSTTTNNAARAADGYARSEIKVAEAANASALATARLEKAQAQAARATSLAEKAQNSLNAQQARGLTEGERYLKTLERQAGTFNKTASEAASFRAAQLGVTNQAAPFIKRIQEAEGAVHKFSLANSGSVRELLVLMREMGRGDWSRFSGSLTILAQRSGALSFILGPVGLGIIAVTAALGGSLAVMFIAEREISHINGLLKNTGNYAGLTADGFRKMAADVAKATGTPLSSATAALDTLVGSGRVTGATMRDIAKASAILADQTDGDAGKIAADFLKMKDGVVSYAIEFNNQHHILSAAQVDYIRLLEQRGDKEAAEATAAKLIFEGVAREGVKQLGYLEQAVRSLGQWWESTWDSIKSIGRDPTTMDKIASARAQLQADLANNPDAQRASMTGSATMDYATQQAAIARDLANLKNLGWQQHLEETDAKLKADIAHTQQLSIEAGNELNTTWLKYTKGADSATEAIARFERAWNAALKGGTQHINGLPMTDALKTQMETAIRKGFDPQGVSAEARARRQEEALAVRQDKALQGVRARLQEESAALDDLLPKKKTDAEFDEIQNKLLQVGIDLRDKKNKKLASEFRGSIAANDNKSMVADANAYLGTIKAQTDALRINVFQRQIQDKLDEIQASRIKAGKTPFSDQQIQNMREALQLQRDMKDAQAMRDKPANDARGTVDGIISGIVGQDTLLKHRQEMYDRIQAMRDADVLGEEAAGRARAQVDIAIQQERLQNTQNFFGALATLQNSSNKTLGAIGKAAAIAQATIDGYLAVQKALASAPPPWNFAMAAVVGVVTAANIANIAGIKFAGGGLVRGPGGPTDDRIHAQLSNNEFVVNARSTQRFLPMLHAINDNRMPQFGTVGATSTQPYSGRMGAPNIIVHNHGTPQAYQVKNWSVSEIELIAQDIADATVQNKAPGVIAGELSSPNSKVHRALTTHTTAQPRRNNGA